MGVQIYLLDRRTVTLLVGNESSKIGTLRRSSKVTEIDGDRAAEIEAAKANIAGEGAPPAVMVADVAEIPLAIEPGLTARFVQNRTLSQKHNKIRGFQKRSFVERSARNGGFWRLCFQNPLSE